MNTDSDNQNGINTKIQDGMNQNGYGTCVHVAKLYHPCSCGHLK